MFMKIFAQDGRAQWGRFLQGKLIFVTLIFLENLFLLLPTLILYKTKNVEGTFNKIPGYALNIVLNVF